MRRLIIILMIRSLIDLLVSCSLPAVEFYGEGDRDLDSVDEGLEAEVTVTFFLDVHLRLTVHFASVKQLLFLFGLLHAQNRQPN